MSTSPRSSSSSLLAAWLCATAGLGYPAAQVKPPEPTDCSQEATEAWEGSKPGGFLLSRNVPVSVVWRWP